MNAHTQPPVNSALDLKHGEDGVIVELRGDESQILALMQLGFAPGTTISRRQAGAFGDPISYSVRGTRVALRRDEAACLIL